jgi:3-dehydroquinate synthase
VFLVGMMGCGKSSVGRALAARLGRAFVDSDEEVERTARATIAELFAREGEAGFRARERRAIARTAGDRRGPVVALGGGAIAQPGMADRLARAGTVVWLRASPATLAARVGEAAERPLLAGRAPAERERRLSELLAERAAHYATAALQVDTDARDVDGVVEAIMAELAPARRVVPVALGERSYDIHLGAGLLSGAGEEIARITKATQAFVVTAPSVARYRAPLLRSLRAAGLKVGACTVPDGDRNKNLRQAARLYDALLDFGADRATVLVVLGGGTVGDLGGFVAATFLRGIPFVQVPTTVLAMVDSSIGGKTGVNLPRGKNLVGSFHQPRGVWIDVEVLRTLPVRERAAGLAEVVKKAAIWDADFFSRLERTAEGALALDPVALVPAIERACQIKAEVVGQDEREAGVRMLLNFGHTLGHAIEALSGYRGLLHGEAVAIGMVFAAGRSEALGLAPPGTRDRIAGLLGRLGLPLEVPSHPRSAYLRALRVDKKRQDARIQFVALRGIGRAETVPLLPEEIVPAARGARRGRRT